jgi:hypothetical protein
MIVKVLESKTMATFEYDRIKETLITKTIVVISDDATEDDPIPEPEIGNYCNITMNQFYDLRKANNDKTRSFDKYFVKFAKEHQCT